jgi:hypothetical protein
MLNCSFVEDYFQFSILVVYEVETAKLVSFEDLGKFATL